MAKFLYRDGANYKFVIDAEIPKKVKLKIGEEITLSKLGMSQEDLHEQTGYEYDEEIDHDILELIEY